MADETISLKELFRVEMAALRELVRAEQEGLALAVKKQEAAYDARFAGVNEFRAALADAVNRAASREYIDARLGEIDRRLGNIETKLAALDGTVQLVKAHEESIAGIKQWQARLDGKLAGWAAAGAALGTLIGFGLLRFGGVGG